MGYYIRVLGKTNPTIPADKLTETLKKENLKASIEIADGTPDNWTLLLIKDKDDRDIFLIEKNEVIEGELGQQEIKEFKEELIDCNPKAKLTSFVSAFNSSTVKMFVEITLECQWMRRLTKRSMM